MLPLYFIALREWLRDFEPRLSLVVWAIWYRRVFQNGPTKCWYMSRHQLLLFTVQAQKLELRFLVHLFSFESLSVSAHY
jgi:hypothetical protein